MSDAGQIRSDRNQSFENSQFLQGANAVYVEQMQARHAADPQSVDAEWRAFFDSVGDAPAHAVDSAAGAPWRRSDWPNSALDETTQALTGEWADVPPPNQISDKISKKAADAGRAVTEAQIKAATLDSIRALMLIRAYRIRGHLVANLDPLNLDPRPASPELEPATYGFGPGDMERPIFLDNVLGMETATMRQIVDLVRRTYCGGFALQYMHISNAAEAGWLKERIEGYGKEVQFTPKGRKAIFNKVLEADGFERFLHVKFVGTKRFGLDGGESLIPAMEQIIKKGGSLGVEEIVIGMPHRGRLNVLSNVMAKDYRAIFHEFQAGVALPDDVDGSGDVKYHLGASSDREFDDNTVHLSLTANPSHLEAVNPVVLGKVRAKQDQRGDSDRTKVLPILLHGDAAFAGQGVVAECFGLSGLTGHRTGGAIHIVVNNQIGFTTAPRFSRSSPYPSDIAMMVEAPIFHVNGDDPEAVVHAARVATEYRQKFHKDVVLDIFCYRRFGHNEGDEPMFTQPKMYKVIKSHPSTLKLYSERLVREGLLSQAEVDESVAAFQQHLAQEFEAAKAWKPNKADWLDGVWQGIDASEAEYQRGETGAPMETLQEIGRALTTVPDGFTLHKTVARQVATKRKIIDEGVGVDWATAEALAFGALIKQGYPVRLSGQDCTRGTFSQRHSAWTDQETEDRYYPLQNIPNDSGASYEVIDSMLSEYAVLGYEYGYSLAEPQTLTLWEAQFGDFANGAQIMIDQFISSGQSKWLRLSGLVMLLPHGYEGQGPEHSSARIERFLQLCAENNWIIANCTTPANYFHILRRQMLRTLRKPLVLFTPKSLLRHPKCTSRLEEMAEGKSFHRVLWDDAQLDDGKSNLTLKPDDQIRRVVLCSGKVYYDLLKERDERGLDDVYLMRLEQLYPFPVKSLRDELKRFKNADVVWCQEEPKNQGPWFFIEPNLEWLLDQIGARTRRPAYCGRKAAASPATGNAAAHKSEQEALIDAALTVSA